MHFFNPVAVLPLVELVRAPATDDVDARDGLGRDEEARQARRARQGCSRLRRQPAPDPPVVRPHAGARERQHVRGDGRGGAAARAPDAARRRSSRWSARGSRTTCSTRSTTRSPTGSRSRRRSRTSRTARWTSSLTGDDRRTEDEIYQRILEALADEARHVLDEGVVASAGEIDACLILGAGFPFFRGGLTPYLDAEGVSTRVSGRPLGGRLKTSVVRPIPVQLCPQHRSAPETRKCADPQGKQHQSRVLRICTRPTSTRHFRRRSLQRAWKPPRSALMPGTASRSSTPVRTRLPRSRPAPPAAPRSTTRSPRWMRAGRRPRTAGASATG